VYSIPKRYGLDDADADDVFQSVFTILYRKLDSLKDKTRLSAWLITTTHRECWRIGKKGNAAATLNEQIVNVGSPTDSQLESWEQQHLVREAVQRLGGQCRDLLTALFLDSSEPSYDQIAERLNIKVGSIGPTRARCFKKLERLLVEMGFEWAPESV
jgi:RNA polymerase sigma factor (sigma-70 family)